MSPTQPVKHAAPASNKSHLSPEWLRPFFLGGLSGVLLVLAILVMIPSSPVHAPQVAQTATPAPVEEVMIDERPLPQLSPNLPSNWNKLKPTPAKQPSPAPERSADTAPIEAPAVKSPASASFVPTPAYQRPTRQRDWADESLFDSN